MSDMSEAQYEGRGLTTLQSLDEIVELAAKA